MKVSDVLYAVDSGTKVAIVDLTTDLYIFPPDSVGFVLTFNDRWFFNAEVETLSIKDNVLVIGLEVE